MFALQKILCPIDFSDRSPAAARYAAALACHFHSELTLLYIVEPDMAAWGSLEFGGLMLAEVIEIQRERAKRDMGGFLADLFPKGKVRRVVLSGDPATSIVDYAHREGSSLIVMPTHGYGVFRRFILGSVTAKVLHDADCPVLTGIHVAGAPANQEFGMANIACAIDLGPDSQRVLGWADQFANTFGSHLTAVHITPAWDRFLGDGVDLGWRANLTREAEVHVEHVRNAVSAKAEILVDTGNDVPSDVCSAAGRLEANLMITGRGGFGKSVGRLRANAYAIIRQSPCAVISV